ncbi:MAG: CYTH domain-containing protein [Sulfuriferula sp.]
MINEIELKLNIAPDDIALLLQHPILLAAGKSQTRFLASHYFDTPTLDLMAQHAAFRVRSIGGLWVQTIKIGGNVVDGLHIRPEWETVIPDNQPHPLLFTDPIIRAVLTDNRAALLQPIFQTEFWRTTWLLTYQDSNIEVALDEGDVSSQGRSQPIHELELELKSGNADTLIKLAAELSQHIVLRPESISKAQRGYALYQEW